MKSFIIKNLAPFRLSINTRVSGGRPGIIHNLQPKEEIKLYEAQMSGDTALKAKKRLISITECLENEVSSSFSNESTVERVTPSLDTPKVKGRKKKT